eukprot:3684168-Karenia_brevis.AAC.1
MARAGSVNTLSGSAVVAHGAGLVNTLSAHAVFASYCHFDLAGHVGVSNGGAVVQVAVSCLVFIKYSGLASPVLFVGIE